MNKKTILPLVIVCVAALAAIVGVFAYTVPRAALVPGAPATTTAVVTPQASPSDAIDVAASESTTASNVYMEGDTQIVEIRAKGMYEPLNTIAKAGVPTIIRMVTDDTFDCTTVVAIPALKYQARLPLTGKTDIPIPVQFPGTKLEATCGMAMYYFDIEFRA